MAIICSERRLASYVSRICTLAYTVQISSRNKMVPEAKNNQFKQEIQHSCIDHLCRHASSFEDGTRTITLTKTLAYGYCLRRKVTRDVSAPNQFRCTYSLVPDISAFVLTAYAYCLRKNPAKDNRTFRIQIISVFRRFYIYRNHWQNQT